ncbi:MAG: hypothetical protein CMJ18_07000 [Phycisphaeraceae bacterium]|nr:hypothetical protein [Phycisphaeraceae bacterium]
MSLITILMAVLTPGVATFDSGGIHALEIKPLEERRQPPSDAAVTAYPMGVVEVKPTFHFIEGTPTSMMLALANPLSRPKTEWWVCVDLPEAVKLVAVNAYVDWDTRKTQAVEHDGRRHARHKLRVKPASDSIHMGKARQAWYANRRPPVIWVTAPGAAGSSPGKARMAVEYRAKDGTLKRGPESTIELAVLPRLEAVRPTLTRTGLMGRCTVSYNPSNADAPAAILGIQAAMGCNLYFDGPPQKLAPEGLKRWTEGWNQWQAAQSAGRHIVPGVAISDGSLLHLPGRMAETIPDEIRFVDINGNRMGNVVSPWSIYERHPWVVRNVLKPMGNAAAKGEYESFWANWEPQPYLRDAGFSEGTKRSFIRWSKMPADEVEKLWPHELVRTYSDKWRAFRGWELGEIVKVCAKTIRTASLKAGNDGHYMIATSADYMYTDERMMDCAAWGDFPYVFQTWSYHNTPQVHESYPMTDLRGASQLVRSARLARRLDELFGTQRQVRGTCKYAWDQSGYCSGYMVPEHFGFRHLSSALAGLEIVHNYGEWPVFDGRWAHELARANTRIARWEPFVLTGVKQRRHVVVPTSPYPQNVPQHVQPEDQAVSSWHDYLHSFEYEKDGQRLIAVANAWDFGEVFFTLRAMDLDPDRKYMLTEPEARRVFTNAERRTALTAGQLAEGITLHVGAHRWGCFLLSPHSESAIEGFDRVTPAGMIAVLQRRAAALRDTFEEQDRIWSVKREIANRHGFVAQIAPVCASRLLVLHTADRAPDIDGSLDDACWKTAAPQGDFRTAQDCDQVSYETSFRAVVHGGTLYVGVDCRQDMTAPAAFASGRDGRAWRDDSVEIFLNGLEPGDEEDYCQVVVNPNGAFYDRWRGDKSWNGIEHVATRTSADGWTLEIAIPLETIDMVPGAHDPALRFNLVRNVIDSKHNRGEKSSWFPSWAAHSDFLARGTLLVPMK